MRIELLGKSNSLIFARNGDRPIKPASNQKLLVAAAALQLLPADFKYRTIIGLWRDNLVIVGSGDPSIGDPVMARSANEPITAVFSHWAARLKSAEITAVKGDLLFDDFIFDEEFVHPSWRKQQKNLQRWYTAPVGGLNFNDNCVDVLIKPAQTLGLPAVVSLIPENCWVLLDNQSQTASKKEPTVTRKGSGPITISVRGPVSAPNTAEHPIWVTVTDPGAFFAHTCGYVLEQHGIKLGGTIRRQRLRIPSGILPKDLRIIDVYERKLNDVLVRMNKSSQNMFAEALLKTLGASVVRDELPCKGSFSGGRAVVVDFLKYLSLP
ncbi:MAG: D-alanyl-D-alanine carboxypeptidase/D-alanyl-D-alanine endopeptidase, partial [Planctomycetota bacterium]